MTSFQLASIRSSKHPRQLPSVLDYTTTLSVDAGMMPLELVYYAPFILTAIIDRAVIGDTIDAGAVPQRFTPTPRISILLFWVSILYQVLLWGYFTVGSIGRRYNHLSLLELSGGGGGLALLVLYKYIYKQ